MNKKKTLFATLPLTMDVIYEQDGFESWVPVNVEDLCIWINDIRIPVDICMLKGNPLKHILSDHIEEIATRAR